MTFVKGRTPWNKGRKASQRERHNLSVAHLGQIAWNKGLNKDQMLEMGKAVGSWPKGVPRSEQTNQKISIANKGNRAWNKGITKESPLGQSLHGGHPNGVPPWNKGKTGVFSEETRKRIGQASKGRVPTQETLRKMSIALKGHTVSEEGKRRIGQNSKAHMTRKWQDPDYILTQLRWRGARPNKIEKQVEAILNSQFPQFKYNGDGRLGIVLARLVPDFVNIDGRKEVIEVFGKHWHNRPEMRWHQTELGRMMAYNSVGFRCLVVWEDELKDEQAVITKIKRFTKKKA